MPQQFKKSILNNNPCVGIVIFLVASLLCVLSNFIHHDFVALWAFAALTVLLLLMIPLWIQLRRNPQDRVFQICLTILWMAFCLVGQSEAHFEILFGLVLFMMSFMLELWPLEFFLLSVLGTLSFWGVCYFTEDLVTEFFFTFSHRELLLQTLLLSVFAGVINRIYNAEKLLHEISFSRFVVIGMQSREILSDLKKSIASPRRTLETLLEKRGPSQDARIDQTLADLRYSLRRMETLVESVSTIAQAGQELEEEVSARQCLEEALQIYSAAFQRVRVLIDSDLNLKTSRYSLHSIYLNIFSNSLHAFREQRIEDPELWVLFKENEIHFYDNAGGFSLATLECLQRNEFHFLKSEGAGLGTYLIYDSARKMGASVLFENTPKGAWVRLVFP